MKQKYLLRLGAILAVAALVCLLLMKGCGVQEKRNNPTGADPVTTHPVIETPESSEPGAYPSDAIPCASNLVMDGNNVITATRIVGEGCYDNTKVFSLKTLDGGAVYAGSDYGAGCDGIFLNLSYSKARDGFEVGFYLLADRGLITGSVEETGLDCDAGTNATHQNFYIASRCFDGVMPATFTDLNNYGVQWQDDLFFDGREGGATISVRAVGLKDLSFLGVYDIKVARSENGRYAIESFTNGDALECGEIGSEDRMEIIQRAMNFVVSNLVRPEQQDGWQEAGIAGAVVDKVSRPYFARFIKPDNHTAKASEYRKCKNTFAVTIPVEHNGYVTVYLAPETEIRGEDGPDTWDSVGAMDLQVYGYDPLRVNTESILAQYAPRDFFD